MVRDSLKKPQITQLTKVPEKDRDLKENFQTETKTLETKTGKDAVVSMDHVTSVI